LVPRAYPRPRRRTSRKTLGGSVTPSTREFISFVVAGSVAAGGPIDPTLLAPPGLKCPDLKANCLGKDQPVTNGRLHPWKSVFWAVIMLFGVAYLVAREPAQSFDMVITNGRIIDGTGSPWYMGDIGIRSGKIAAIGNLSAAPRARTIDARRMVVAPG